MVFSYLEFLGMALGIVGSILMATSSKDKTKPLLYAYYAYGLSNYVLLFVVANAGLVFVYSQMIIFGLLGLRGIYTFGNKNTVFYFASVLFLSIISSSFFFNENVFVLDFKELILTVFAIVGTVFLANKNHIIREYAFILFILADIGFVYLFFSNELIFMTMQYAFYLITSSIALYRNEGYLYNLMRNSFRSYVRAVLDCYAY